MVFWGVSNPSFTAWCSHNYERSLLMSLFSTCPHLKAPCETSNNGSGSSCTTASLRTHSLTLGWIYQARLIDSWVPISLLSLGRRSPGRSGYGACVTVALRWKWPACEPSAFSCGLIKRPCGSIARGSLSLLFPYSPLSFSSLWIKMCPPLRLPPMCLWWNTYN